jgi:4-hydroxy-L-threonine phosphate dehydrogenase PdxA
LPIRGHCTQRHRHCSCRCISCRPESDRRRPGELAVVEIDQPIFAEWGRPEPRNAASVIGALQQAAAGCLRGEFDGLVTGPVHKAAINDGGIAYTGTTELLANQAGREVVMMLANDIVRVALVTTHLPLREVPDAITPQAVERTIRTTHAALRHDFGIVDPVIAVLGLNPHAGEAGHLGGEEIAVIEPVLAALREEGLQLVGPLPADTAFLPTKLRGFDAVVAIVPRPGSAGAQVQRLRASGQPHSGSALPARRRRSWHRARSGRPRHRRSFEPVRRCGHLRADRPASS